MNGTYRIGHVWDRIRVQSGDSAVRSRFEAVLQTNFPRAISMLNDPSLSYPTFFVLIPQVLAYQITDLLSPKLHFALAFTTQYHPDTEIPHAQESFTWMLLSSMHQELDSEEFQDLIDQVVIQILLVYHDLSLLPNVVELIFLRNRKDYCIYDLCWVIFQAHTVKTMSLVSAYLKSNQRKDNELAYHLLNFKPERQPKNRMQQYQNFLKWFRENQPFLYFANETMLETCHPKFWRVNLPAKYLCKPELQEELLSDLERYQLHAFFQLDRDAQKLVSKFSYRLYLKDPYLWQRWIQSSPEMQLHDSRQRAGGNP